MFLSVHVDISLTGVCHPVRRSSSAAAAAAAPVTPSPATATTSSSPASPASCLPPTSRRGWPRAALTTSVGFDRLAGLLLSHRRLFTLDSSDQMVFFWGGEFGEAKEIIVQFM